MHLSPPIIWEVADCLLYSAKEAAEIVVSMLSVFIVFIVFRAVGQRPCDEMLS